MAIGPHPLVKALAKTLNPPGGPSSGAAGTPGALAHAPDLPELVTFAGFLGDTVQQPGLTTDWRMLYLDWRLLNWLLVKDDDVLHAEKVKDPTAPTGERDVIWLDADALVSGGSGAQSVESRFLTGDFTRAGDYEARPNGATIGAETGVFCEAERRRAADRKTRE